MEMDLPPQKGREVARITQAQNAREVHTVPPGRADLLPGAEWLVEHGGYMEGHIEEGTGDIVIDKHIPPTTSSSEGT